MGNSLAENESQLVSMVEEFNDIVEQTFYFEQRKYELEKKIEANKQKILKGLGRRNRLQVRVDNNLAFEVLRTTHSKIEFHIEQLQQNLSKEHFKQICDTQVMIDDLKEFIKFLKRHGVKPEDFKTFITTTKSVNKDELDKLIELGDIEINDLQGSYTAEFEDEIRVKKIK